MLSKAYNFLGTLKTMFTFYPTARACLNFLIMMLEASASGVSMIHEASNDERNLGF